MSLKNYFFTTLEWKISDVAKSLFLSENETKEYFRDGRRCSFLVERRIRDIINGKLAPSEGSSYDLIDKQGNNWEVRSLTKGGIYFTNSRDIGSSRTFNEEGFLKKLDNIKGYIVSDISHWPNVPVYKITSQNVLLWYNSNKLSSNTKISKNKFFELINE